MPASFPFWKSLGIYCPKSQSPCFLVSKTGKHLTFLVYARETLLLLRRSFLPYFTLPDPTGSIIPQQFNIIVSTRQHHHPDQGERKDEAAIDERNSVQRSRADYGDMTDLVDPRRFYRQRQREHRQLEAYSTAPRGFSIMSPLVSKGDNGESFRHGVDEGFPIDMKASSNSPPRRWIKRLW